MIDFTPLTRPYFGRRASIMKRDAMSVGRSQAETLDRLLKKASKTAYGERYGFNSINNADDYRHRVPVVTYPDIRDYVLRMVNGERNILWPGLTDRFAQSSGTSDGKSKYIPLTPDSLQQTHYRGGADVVAAYLDLYRDSRLFAGRSFILGGSFGNTLDTPHPGVKVGDLSAHLIDKINPAANLVRVPSKSTALLEDWHEKLPRLVEEAANKDITNISGVPSWFLTVLKEIIRSKGASTIHDVWPNLEVFFHGGIAFGPYREEYDMITDRTRMRYLETYNASEGFFAVQDRIDSRALLLLMDVATYYEFVPLDYIDDPFPPSLTAAEVKPGEIYALVISSCNGLWRYMIGDTVKIETVNPLRITIAGRTKSFINAFGEELMVFNADAALRKACEATGATVVNYTTAPVYTHGGSKGHHQWLVEFGRRPDDLESFADILDRQLTIENSDYQAKRSGNIFLDRLELTEATPGQFDRWLASTGKLGGQRKIPRLSNDRRVIDGLLQHR